LRFCSLTSSSAEKASLEADYKNGREIGIIRLGEKALFFRKHFKIFYVSYNELTRCFRRVLSVPAKLCCGKGEFVIENLVIYTGETEAAQIQLPGTKAARILIEELKKKSPDTEFAPPEEKQCEDAQAQCDCKGECK